MRIRLAGAPVSFGHFGPYAGPADDPGPQRLLAGLADAGYRGVDLGPPGWLGDQRTLRPRLRTSGLDLAGGWVDLPFADGSAYRERAAGLDAALDLFVAARGPDAAWWPRPTLAISATSSREAAPCTGDRGGGLPAGRWREVARNLADAMQRCRDRGLEPTFHHHVATDIEGVNEIERLLELTDIGLTLDTGHLLMVGGDPVDALRRWAARINHVHVKDVHLDVVRAGVAAGDDVHALWRRSPFPPVGEGDLDLAGVAAALHETSYAGWVVVEQDVAPLAGTTFAAMLRDQATSLDHLAAALQRPAPPVPDDQGVARP